MTAGGAILGGASGLCISTFTNTGDSDARLRHERKNDAIMIGGITGGLTGSTITSVPLTCFLLFGTSFGFYCRDVYVISKQGSNF